LQNRLVAASLLYHQYDKPKDFRERIILDLFEAVVRIRTEVERSEQLKGFFRFGVSTKRESPSVLIGYPPIHKHIQKPNNLTATSEQKSTRRHRYNWQERLLPNVVFEDMKCIQKIEAAVRLTGVQDISSVTIDHPRLQTDVGNRIWLCLPRNNMAQRRLSQIGQRVWFRFERRKEEDRPHIIWSLEGQNPIEIQSPMAKYLHLQRRPKSSSWDLKFGSIVARDYAVIGRFAMQESKGLTRDDPYYHYFVAGIRGLGTWGAGWFIDRRPDGLQRLVKIADKKAFDAQILLEVTYSNYRIVAVKDVSYRDEHYFKKQLADEIIYSIIERYR
ncbi:MAG: hypothetical protein SV375_20175, partial [Thermodesulfobacteriota bacterium]|nr:hypothetical protein [Thermodesulfobacteriota bacterium]